MDVIIYLNIFIEYIADENFLLEFYSSWSWLIFLFPTIWMAKTALHHLRIEYDRHTWKWVLLAIDVPKDNEQSPKAVEQMFAHLAGAHASQDLVEIHWKGYTQKWFSFEVVSIEGYVQFLIYTERQFRSLIEATIYAQYPDAEITEVEDYTKGIPTEYPNNEYDVWGADFKQTRPHFYPIRTYREFEDMRTGEFIDPMSAMLETMGRMGQGEQLWFQLLVKPIGVEWKEHGYELVKKLAGAPSEHKATIGQKIGEVPGMIVSGTANAIFGSNEEHAEKKHDMPSKVLYMTPGERSDLEAIEKKLSKIGFSCKMRVLYVAKKDKFNKSNAVQSIVGSIKQFNTEDLNSIIPDMKKTAVTAHYIWVDKRKNWRKSRLVNWYKARSIWCGTAEYVLNIEELATIWHFPVLTRSGGLKQTEFKKAGPPHKLSAGRYYNL